MTAEETKNPSSIKNLPSNFVVLPRFINFEDPVPKFINKMLIDLIRSFVKNHLKCKYHLLLEHSCPNTLQKISQEVAQVLAVNRTEEPKHEENDPKSLISDDKKDIIINKEPADLGETDKDTDFPLPYHEIFDSMPFFHRFSHSQKKEYMDIFKSKDFSTPVHQVVLFCKNIMRKIFPKNLIGGPQNWKWLFISLEAYVKLRKREELRLSYIVENMTTDDLIWTWSDQTIEPPKVSEPVSAEEQRHRQVLLLELMYWIFNFFLPTLIRSHFYATEISRATPVNRVVYFRHDIWFKISRLAFSDFCNQSHLVKLSSDEASQIEKNSPLGIAPIRIVPKEQVITDGSSNEVKITGYRPILCLGRNRKRNLANAPSTQNLSSSSSNPHVQNLNQNININANTILRDLFFALSHEHSRKVRALFRNRFKTLSSSFSGYDSSIPTIVGTIASIPDLYHRIIKFKRQIQRNNFNEKSEVLPQLYFVKVDIKKCYDTIPQDVALRIAQRLLEAGKEYDVVMFREYFMHAFRMIKVPVGLPSSKSEKPTSDQIQKQNEAFFQNVQTKYLRQVEYTTATQTGMDTAYKLSKSNTAVLQESAVNGPDSMASRTASVVVDYVYGTKKDGEELANLLKWHLKSNLVYLESVGMNRNGGNGNGDTNSSDIYHQQIGIPQGSVLSNLLCNLVYEELELKLLKDIFSINPSVCLDDDEEDVENESQYSIPKTRFPPSMLVRFTDDFLFATTSKAHAERFLKSMIRGFPEYGATISPEKSIINFTPGGSCSETKIMEDGSNTNNEDSTSTLKLMAQCKIMEPWNNVMPYIGLGINTTTLELLRGPSTTLQPHGDSNSKKKRFGGNSYGDVPDRVSLPPRGSPERSDPKAMCRKLISFISMRLLRAFVDLNLNSWETVLDNVRSVTIDVVRRIVFAIKVEWGFLKKSNNSYLNNQSTKFELSDSDISSKEKINHSGSDNDNINNNNNEDRVEDEKNKLALIDILVEVLDKMVGIVENVNSEESDSMKTEKNSDNQGNRENRESKRYVTFTPRFHCKTMAISDNGTNFLSKYKQKNGSGNGNGNNSGNEGTTWYKNEMREMEVLRWVSRHMIDEFRLAQRSLKGKHHDLTCTAIEYLSSL